MVGVNNDEPRPAGVRRIKEERFAELDALRGFAAVAVVLFHYTAHVNEHLEEIGFSLSAGRHGVQLFFCVSGFVILWSLRRASTLPEFAVSRFSRLYPAYWASMAISSLVGVLLLQQKPWIGGILTNATMLQTFLGYPNLEVVYWTLAVELAFYVWMGIFFALGKLDRMAQIIFAWVAISVAAEFGARAGWQPPQWLETYFILKPIPYFAAGTVFYLVSKDGWSRFRILMVLFALAAAASQSAREGIVAATVFLIFSLAVAGKLQWIVNPVSAWLGAISYTLYLIHPSVGYATMNWLHSAGWGGWAAMLAAIILALVLASMMTMLIERPAMYAIRTGYKRCRGPSA